MGLTKRTLSNGRDGFGYFWYLGLFFTVVTLGFLLYGRIHKERRPAETKQAPPAKVQVDRLTEAGAKVNPVTQPTVATPPPATDIAAGGRTGAPPSEKPVTPPPPPPADQSGEDPLDAASRRLAATGGDRDANQKSVGDPLPDIGGEQPQPQRNPSSGGAGEPQLALQRKTIEVADTDVVFAPSKKKSTESAPAFSSPSSTSRTAREGAVAPRKSGFQTGRYLLGGTKIHVAFTQGVQTFSGDSSVILTILEPVSFLGQKQLVPGLRILGTMGGNDFVRNRIMANLTAIQFPQGQRIPITGVLVGDDDAVGVPAYFHDTPVDSQVAPFVGSVLSEYMAQARSYYAPSQSGLASALGLATQPKFDTQTAALNAVAGGMQKSLDARMAYYSRLNQPYLEIKKEMTAWVQLREDTDLTVLIQPGGGVINSGAPRRIGGPELDSLPHPSQGSPATGSNPLTGVLNGVTVPESVSTALAAAQTAIATALQQTQAPSRGNPMVNGLDAQPINQAPAADIPPLPGIK